MKRYLAIWISLWLGWLCITSFVNDTPANRMIGGEKDGYWYEYDEAGRLLAEGHYKTGMKVSNWSFYFETDSTFHSKQDQIDFARKNLLKKNGVYEENLKSHYWKCYFSTGKLEAEGWFTQDKKDKYWKFYDNSGKIKEEGHYKKGSRVDWWREYPAENILIKGQYANNVKDGFWQTLEGEELISVSKFEKGKLIATWKSYEEYLNWKKD